MFNPIRQMAWGRQLCGAAECEASRTLDAEREGSFTLGRFGGVCDRQSIRYSRLLVPLRVSGREPAYKGELPPRILVGWLLEANSSARLSTELIRVHSPRFLTAPTRGVACSGRLIVILCCFRRALKLSDQQLPNRPHCSSPGHL